MHDWNVVATVHEGGFNKALRILKRFGAVERTDFFNILVMRTGEEPLKLMDELLVETERDPQSVSCLARVMPVVQTFVFQTPAEFDEKARLAVCAWIPALAGKGFHLRMHRRGFKGKLSSMDEEKFLDTYLLEALETAGTPGRITFSDPDAVIALETIGPRAGLSFWRREELSRYPLLHLD